ncbi:phosphotransferase [Deinococcus soli (ex Cha et al. 2016)]
MRRGRRQTSVFDLRTPGKTPGWDGKVEDGQPYGQGAALAVQLAEVALVAPASGHAVLVHRSGRTVVRVASARGAFVVKVDTDGDGLTREAQTRAYLRTCGVPIDLPTAGPSGDPAWLVLPWVEGKALSSSMPVQARQKVGALLARIHALPGGRPPPQDQSSGTSTHCSPSWSRQERM